MEMHNEMNRDNERILGEANEHLYAIGLIDTVDTYLNSEDAHAIVGAAYDNWINSLKEFVGKLPEVAREAAMKVVEDADSTKEDFRPAIYLGFKQNLSESLVVLESYASIENLVAEMKENPGRNQMWGIKLANLCKMLLEVADERVKFNIIIEAIGMTGNIEDQMALSEVIVKEPNGMALMAEIDRRMYADEAASAPASSLMSAIFGGDFTDDEDDEE